MPVWLWIAFLAGVAALILLDLGVFHRKAHVVSLPQALGRTAFWMATALAHAMDGARKRLEDLDPRR